MEYVLITGGTSGIGYELAKRFAREGYGIIIAATNNEKLKKVKAELERLFKIKVVIYQQDLSVIGSARELYNKVKEDNLNVSILVNNAGIGLVGATNEIDFNKDKNMMILNIITVVDLSKLFINDMYKMGKGKILNISSTGAFQPGPYTSTYFASKAFVLSYSRAMRYEARKKNIDVCVLCPGATKTNFFNREGTSTPRTAISAEKVADYAYRRLMKNKEITIPGIVNKIEKFIPVKIKMRVVAKMKEI